MATRSVVISISATAVALAAVPWGGSQSRRERVAWLPAANVPFLTKSGMVSPAWRAFLVELAENRMGGVNGTTLPMVQVAQAETQAQAVAAAGIATDVNAYARAIAATATATAQVTQNAAVPGSATIPPVPEPPDPGRWRDG